jgi:hypothetical protein
MGTRNAEESRERNEDRVDDRGDDADPAQQSTQTEAKPHPVGYGRLPERHRFRKRQSGNLRGRPKGAKGVRASLQRELESLITVREGGREMRMPKADAIAKRLVEKALKGDAQALRLLLATTGAEQPAAADTGAAERPRRLDLEERALLRDYLAAEDEQQQEARCLGEGDDDDED